MHVLNRGNARSEVFHKPGDYWAFLQAMSEASVRLPMRLLAYCVMPNHFHMVLRPQYFQDVKRAESILFCESCQRILYYNPPQAFDDLAGAPDAGGTVSPVG